MPARQISCCVSSSVHPIREGNRYVYYQVYVFPQTRWRELWRCAKKRMRLKHTVNVRLGVNILMFVIQ